MRHLNLCVGLVALLAVTGCGSKGAKTASNGGGASSSSSAPSGNASAEQVAKEMRGKVHCPAKVAEAAPAGGPVIDVVGLRPGITYDEAVNIVECDNPLLVVTEDKSRGFNINTYGQKIRQGFDGTFAVARVQKTGQQIVQEMENEAIARGTNAISEDMKPGQVKYYVATMGVPGQEKVIYATREEWFNEGKNPPVDSVIQALTAKYGEPTKKLDIGPIDRQLEWDYDPNGRPITETSPLYNQCNGVADPDSGTNFSPDCGVIVRAQIRSLKDNPGLAKFMQAGVMDQANGYAAITGTEEALHKMDLQRQQDELNKAGKNADAPKL
ncbi:MAG: hypothetical protein GC155_02565 [Alphaproteobacteria bacterium]|nr:hypothetical protein [Alphaproteobacteria bacterium]